MVRPLSGVTIVSLEQAVAAPFATRQLADFGARVIKIERPVIGDFARHYDESVGGESSYFVWLNRSKESVTLNIKTDEGHKILHELVDQADVVVQNLGPGAANRIGLGAKDVLARDPRKIVLNITGWGSDGPWSQKKAYDLLVQNEVGLVSLTGSLKDPARVGISIADIAAGVYGFSGVLAALYQREVSGKGASVEVSLFEALAEWMGQPMHYAKGSGASPSRVGAHHATIAPYGPFTASDGNTIVIAIQSRAEWDTFCDIFMADATLASDPRFETNALRVASRTTLNSLISKRFLELDTPSIVELLEGSKTAFASMSTMAEFSEHPILAGRDRWRTVATSLGETRALLPPIQFGDDEARMDPVPGLGAHTEQVLTELGRSPADIAKMRERNVI